MGCWRRAGRRQVAARGLSRGSHAHEVPHGCGRGKQQELRRRRHKQVPALHCFMHCKRQAGQHGARGLGQACARLLPGGVRQLQGPVPDLVQLTHAGDGRLASHGCMR